MLKQKARKLLECPYDLSRIAKEPFSNTPNGFLCLSLKGKFDKNFSSADEVRNFFKKIHSCTDIQIEVLDFKRELWIKINFKHIRSAQLFEEKLLQDLWFQATN